MKLIQGACHEKHLAGKQLIIAAINFLEVNRQICGCKKSQCFGKCVRYPRSLRLLFRIDRHERAFENGNFYKWKVTNNRKTTP